MAKKAKKVAGMIAIAVSSFGRETVALSLPEGATVSDALEKAGINLTGREKTYVSGDEVDSDDELEDGDVLSIVTPKAAGSDGDEEAQ